MNPYFRTQLETAQRVNGVAFDPVADWDELADLYTLADAVTESEARGDAATLRPCVEIGGVLFHRITIGAAHWFQRVAGFFGEDRGELYGLAFAYTMAGSRDPVATLWPYGDSMDALKRRLKEWRAALGCTPEELFTAIGEFTAEEHERPMPGDVDRGEVERKSTGHGWLVDVLCSEYGGTPEQWIWHTPRAQLSQLLAEINSRRRAEKGAAQVDPNDPRVIASHRFDLRLKALVASKKKAA